MEASASILHNPAEQCFELAADDGHAFCAYRRQGDLLALVHTEVPPHWQGRGVAARLVQATLDWARAEGLRVQPRCSYVVAYMRRHPETRDLLAG